MSERKEEAALLAQNDPTGKPTVSIVTAFDDAVKRNDLRTVLDVTETAPRDAVKLLHQYFPSFDKTVLSKCCKPDKYGCVLHPDGYTALKLLLGVNEEVEAAPQEAAKKPQKKHSHGSHKFNCRVAGRLPDDKFLRLQRYIRLEGWDTTQDWVTAQVDAYIKEMEAKYGSDPKSPDC